MDALLEESIVAGTDTHGMVPRDGESPEDEGAEDSLAKNERKNVAAAGEKPAHCRTTNEGEWNEDGIRPVKRGKKQTADQRRDVGI